MAGVTPWRRADYVAFFEGFLNGAGRSMSKTRFGYFAVGNPSFVKNLRDTKREVELGTLERAIAFVENFKEA